MAALTREAQASAAGLSAQAPGLAMDAYRQLRSSEDARADGARQNKMQLAGLLTDWNQNLQNLAFQTYATDLGFFGDRQEAQQSAQEFLANMGLQYDQLAQDESQFARSDARTTSRGYGAARQQRTLRGSPEGGRAPAGLPRQVGGKAASRAQDLAEGRDDRGAERRLSRGSTRAPGGGTRHRPYSYKEAYRLLSQYLTPAWESNEARRYNLKQKGMDRIIRNALRQAGFGAPQRGSPTHQ